VRVFDQTIASIGTTLAFSTLAMGRIRRDPRLAAWFSASTTTANWTQWHAAFGFTNAHTFSVNARSEDTAGNFDLTTSTGTFLYDIVPPNSYVSNPANTALSMRTLFGTISGTSSDPNSPLGASGVKSILIAIQDKATGLWWSAGDGRLPRLPPVVERELVDLIVDLSSIDDNPTN